MENITPEYIINLLSVNDLTDENADFDIDTLSQFITPEQIESAGMDSIQDIISAFDEYFEVLPQEDDKPLRAHCITEIPELVPFEPVAIDAELIIPNGPYTISKISAEKHKYLENLKRAIEAETKPGEYCDNATAGNTLAEAGITKSGNFRPRELMAMMKEVFVLLDGQKNEKGNTVPLQICIKPEMRGRSLKDIYDGILGNRISKPAPRPTPTPIPPTSGGGTSPVIPPVIPANDSQYNLLSLVNPDNTCLECLHRMCNTLPEMSPTDPYSLYRYALMVSYSKYRKQYYENQNHISRNYIVQNDIIAFNTDLRASCGRHIFCVLARKDAKSYRVSTFIELY